VTHQQWQATMKRLLEVSVRKPKVAARCFHRLARTVDTGLKKGLHDWHVMQSLQLASLAEAAAGDHHAAARTRSRIVDHQRMLLVGEQRAYVSACAAAAIEFAKAGDLRAAKRTILAAEPWARMLRPPEKLLRTAQELVGA
jgi:hypothetical protein